MTIRNDTRTNDYFRDIAALAKAEGEGANSRPEFGRKTFVAASDGVIAPGKGKEDVGDVVKIHEHYQNNIAKKFVGTAPMQDESSLKVQLSKLRTIISVGAHPVFRTRTDGTSPAGEFIALFDDVLSVMQIANKRSLPVYDKLVSVCRAQRTKFKSKTEMLTREEIAAAMAEGALANSEAHLALSTTGIAGPGGAVPGKPVGTVCFGWVVGGVTHTERKVFSGDRIQVRQQTVLYALNKLLRYVDEL